MLPFFVEEKAVRLPLSSLLRRDAAADFFSEEVSLLIKHFFAIKKIDPEQGDNPLEALGTL